MIYDIECKECKKVFERICKVTERYKPCDCGGKVKILITTPSSKDWFRPHWNPEFDIKPIYVGSKGKLKELCLKHDVTSRALGDVRNITEI